jgi:hypothetical protein
MSDEKTLTLEEAKEFLGKAVNTATGAAKDAYQVVSDNVEELYKKGKALVIDEKKGQIDFDAIKGAVSDTLDSAGKTIKETYAAVQPQVEGAVDETGNWLGKNWPSLLLGVGALLLGNMMGMGMIGTFLIALVAFAAGDFLGNGNNGMIGSLLGLNKSPQQGDGHETAPAAPGNERAAGAAPESPAAAPETPAAGASINASKFKTQSLETVGKIKIDQKDYLAGTSGIKDSHPKLQASLDNLEKSMLSMGDKGENIGAVQEALKEALGHANRLSHPNARYRDHAVAIKAQLEGIQKELEGIQPPAQSAAPAAAPTPAPAPAAESTPAPTPAADEGQSKVALGDGLQHRILLNKDGKAVERESMAEIIIVGQRDLGNETFRITGAALREPERGFAREGGDIVFQTSPAVIGSIPKLTVKDDTISLTRDENEKRLSTLKTSLQHEQTERLEKDSKRKEVERLAGLAEAPELTNKHLEIDQAHKSQGRDGDKPRYLIVFDITGLDKNNKEYTARYTGQVSEWDQNGALASDDATLTITSGRRLENGKPVGDELVKNPVKIEEVQMDSRGLDIEKARKNGDFQDGMRTIAPVSTPTPRGTQSSVENGLESLQALAGLPGYDIGAGRQ